VRVSRFFVSPDSPEGWAEGLAQESHWRRGYSAHSLAYTWHPSDGFPPSVADAFAASELGHLEFIVGVPEYKVALPGGDRASQTDLFVLARTQTGEKVAIAVEGKALEAFGDKTVAEWRTGGSEGKAQRLRFLLRVLGLPDDAALSQQRYQLLHRTASPLVEAKRLNATHAVMLVHSFGGENRWFDEFAAFARLLGAEPQVGGVSRAARSSGSLFLGWVSDDHPAVA
jgi:hypothetical protein